MQHHTTHSRNTTFNFISFFGSHRVQTGFMAFVVFFMLALTTRLAIEVWKTFPGFFGIFIIVGMYIICAFLPCMLFYFHLEANNFFRDVDDDELVSEVEIDFTNLAPEEIATVLSSLKTDERFKLNKTQKNSLQAIIRKLMD